MAEVNLTLGDPIEVKVTPAEGATNVSVASAPQNVVQVQAAIATNGLQGADGIGVPAGGDEGQALVKTNDTDYQTQWAFIDKLHISVRNSTGATIPAGSVVYASGLQGNDILIDLADASDASKMPAIGFTYEDIEDGDPGDVISAGVLVRSVTVDVAGTADIGDTMYVSPTNPGGVTTIRPSDAAHKVQNVGIALKVSGNNNNVTKFKVSAIDRVNDVPNLEDGHFFLGGATNTTSPYELPISSPTNGQLLKANADGNLVFVNASDVTKNIGTVDLTTTNTTRNLDIIEDGHLNIRDAQNDPILYIDEATKRVGINTTTLDKPAALFVNGDVLFRNGSTIGVEGSQEFNIGKIGSAGAAATVNVTADLSVSGNCTIDTNLKFGTGGNQLHANTTNTFEFGKNGSGSANYKFNSDVGTVTFDNTTDVELKNAGGLKIFNSLNSVSIQSPSLASSYTLTLPNSSGTDGYVLKTDGSGTTSWVDVTAVSDALLDSDFSDADSGLMKKASAGTYEIATADTDYQSVPSEGAFADGDKTKLDYITVGAAVNLDNAVLTTTSDVSDASFVDTDDTFDSATDNLVPSQLAVKTYVDSQRKAAVYVDQSDAPQLHASVSEAEMKSLLNLTDLDIRSLINQGPQVGPGGFTYSSSNGAISYVGPTDADIRAPFGAASSGSGSLTYSASTGVFTYTGPDLSSYLTSVTSADVTAHEADLTIATTQLTGLSATGNVSGVTLSQVDGAFTLGGSISITESQISDFGTYLTGSSSTSDLSDVNGGGSANGQLLIYNQGTSKYDVNTLNAGNNITITEGAGTIEIAATDTGIANVQADSTPALGGNLNVNDFHIVSDASEHITIASGSGGDVNIDGEPVNIKHDSTTRLATSSTGVTVTGHLDMADDDEIRLGTDNDFRIKYDSVDDDGELRASTIALKGSNDDFMLLANTNGGVSLYHDDSRKFDTTSGGVAVTGYAEATGYTTSFTSTLSAVGNHRGATLIEGVYTSGSITNGKVYQMGSTAWAEGHADGEATASGLLAIATSTSASGKFVTKGLVKVLDIKGTNPQKGEIVYLSEDAAESGYVTVDRPSADGDIVRIVGYVVNSTSDMIYFDPSPDFIEVA